MKDLDSFLEGNEAIRKMMQLKSNLILEAEWLKASRDAREKYAQAAEKEYQIYQILREHRYSQDALTNLLSCASCWIEAEYYTAADAVISKILRHKLSLKQKRFVQQLRRIAQRHLKTPLMSDLLYEKKGKEAQKESIFEEQQPKNFHGG